MLPAGHRGVGQNICPRDVCLTPPPPPKPIPYVNIGMHSMAIGYSPNVYVTALNALHILTTIPITLGDQPGVLGPGPMRVGEFQQGNPVVKVNMIPAVNLTCPATGNAQNCKGASAVPDAVNVFYTFAREASSEDAEDEILALRAAIADAPAPHGEMGASGVAFLRISVFGADVSTLVYNEVQRLEGEGMRALVIDLRGCPGGDMAGALRLAEDFVPRGTPLARVVDSDGDEIVHRGRRERPYRMPLAVQVDGGTASAAELFAGAMQSSGRAVLIGERTYGKDSTQRVIHDLTTGAASCATVASFRLPDGRAIGGEGLSPDMAHLSEWAPGGASGRRSGEIASATLAEG